MSLADIIQRGCDAVGAGNLNTLVADYVANMPSIMPGQTGVLHGRQPFRSVPLWIASGRFFPPGFEITGLRHFEGDNEVISIVEWKSQKVSESKLSVLFRFKDDEIYEER